MQIKGRVGDSGETSKSKIDFVSIQLKKIQSLSSDPTKATPKHRVGEKSPANCVIAKCIQLSHVSFSQLQRFKVFKAFSLPMWGPHQWLSQVSLLTDR